MRRQQSQKSFIPAPSEKSRIPIHEALELQVPGQVWLCLCLSLPPGVGHQVGSCTNPGDSFLNGGSSPTNRHLSKA